MKTKWTCLILALLNQGFQLSAAKPVIVSEFSVGDFVAAPAPRDQSVPSVVSDGKDFLAIWADRRNRPNNDPNYTDLYASRVAADGRVLDPGGLLMTRDATYATAASNGKDYLLVWESQKTIYAARIGNSGKLLDVPPIRIASSSGDNQIPPPQVASNGRDFLVVWTKFDPLRQSTAVYGARLTAEGALLDPRGITLSSGTRRQAFPVVASSGGDYFVAWIELRGNSLPGTFRILSGIVGTRVNRSGQVLDPGSVLISENETPKGPVGVTAHPSGYFVVWSEAVPQGGITYGYLHGMAVTREGTPLRKDSTLVAEKAEFMSAASEGADALVFWRDPPLGTPVTNIYATRVSGNGAVTKSTAASFRHDIRFQTAAASNGQKLLTVWSDRRNAAASGWDIYGALSTNALPSKVEGDFLVSNTLKSGQSAPVVASNGNEHLVAWFDNREAPSPPVLYGTLLSSSGTPLGAADFRISAEPIGRCLLIANSEDFLAVWSGNGLRGMRITRNGISMDLQPITLTTARSAGFAASANGRDYLLVWADISGTVNGARLNRQGSMQPPGAFTIGRLHSPLGMLAAASNGTDFLVVSVDARNFSQTEWDLYAARVTSTGDVLETDSISVTVAPGEQTLPSVTSDGRDYLVVWQDRRDPGPSREESDIYGARVSGDGRVLDPAGFRINPTDGANARPSVASVGRDYPTGEYVVVWQYEDTNGKADFRTLATRVASDGELPDPAPLTINAQSVFGARSVIAYGNAGRFLIASPGFRDGAEPIVGVTASTAQSVVIRKTGAVISWMAEPGKTYRVQSKDDLNASVWSDLGGEITATNRTLSVVDERISAASQRFYRRIEIPARP